MNWAASMNIGGLDQALTSSQITGSIDPTALMNLGSIYKDLGNLIRLLPPLKSLDVKPDDPAL